jgi:hypothetical protein
MVNKRINSVQLHLVLHKIVGNQIKHKKIIIRVILCFKIKIYLIIQIILIILQDPEI